MEVLDAPPDGLISTMATNPPPPLSDTEISRIAAAIKQDVVDQTMKKAQGWIWLNILAISGVFAMSVLTYNKVQDAASKEQLTAVQKDIKRDLRTLITHTDVATKVIVETINNAEVKGSSGKVLRIDPDKVKEPFREAKADLAASIQAWDDLPIPAPAVAFRRGEEVVLKIVKTAAVNAPMPGSVTVDGEGVVRIKNRLTEKSAGAFSVRAVHAGNAKDREITLRGLTAVWVKTGQPVREGDKLGEVSPSKNSVFNELSLRYSKAGTAVPPDSDLPIFDRGQEVFFDRCHSCHGSAKLITTTKPGIPTLCGLGAKNRPNLRNGKPVTLENVVNVVKSRMPRYHEQVRQSLPAPSEADIEATALYITRKSPSWPDPQVP